MKRPVDGTALRQDRVWQPVPIPQLQPGSRALGAAPDPGTGHQPGVRDGPWARVSTQMRYKAMFGGRLWYSYSL